MEIKVVSVRKRIRNSVVLDGIHLNLCGGNIYGLSGENGSGKTMLLKAISGLITPTKGSIFYDGLELGKDITIPPSIGVLIESPSFIDKYTGLKNLSLLAMIKGQISKNQVRDALKDVSLDPDDKKPYRKYSLGMKQKLGIACALMENPDVVLLDEPFNALDERSVSIVQNLIIRHRDRGAIVVVAAHDLTCLAAMCDERLVMHKGRLE